MYFNMVSIHLADSLFLFSRSQFKAHGIDERVFKPPVLPMKKESKPTKIEPFHLTESHKKEVVT